jgi:hypothetical protein
MPDDRYLGDIKIEHGDMLKDIMKDAKIRTFPSIVYGRAYRGAMMTNALKMLGVDAPAVFDLALDHEQAAERIDSLLVLNEVVIENKRNDHPELPPWECGIYLYKANVLIYFISIMFPKGNEFTVTTNVPEL